MTNAKTTRKALLSSVVALMLCFTMLMGTTFAWFTDSVSSVGNIIQSGTLKVDLLHGDVSLKENADHKVFDYDKWEPGYTQVETLTAVNEGTLALKYVLTIFSAEGTAELGENGENLADVIDVYLLDAPTATRPDLSGMLPIGTLAELMADEDGAAYGVLYANGDTAGADKATVTIALKMREEAGNEYQGLSLGDLYISLVATQYTYEADSFDNQYDKDAEYDGVTVRVSSPKQLQNALKVDNAHIVLEDDINFDESSEYMFTTGLNGALLYLYHDDVTIDLNGHDIIAPADAVMEGKNVATALFLVRYSTLNIVGEGNIITENQAIPVYGWAHSTINIYGGNYISSAALRKESAVYVNNATVTINVYGGTYTDSDYGFNVHDTSVGSSPAIVLHEGVEFIDYNGLFLKDYNRGGIVLADGCKYVSTVIDDTHTSYKIVAE